MKAYLIDPDTKSITEVEHTGDYREIYTFLGEGVTDFNAVVINEHNDCIYVDGEFLLKNKPMGWFRVASYHRPLGGRGLVLGTDEAGDSRSPIVSLGDIKEHLVGFVDPPTPEQIDDWSVIRVYSL